jgi:hypothetical protein
MLPAGKELFAAAFTASGGKGNSTFFPSGPVNGVPKCALPCESKLTGTATDG